MNSADNILFHELVRVINRYRNEPHVEIEMRLGWKPTPGTPFQTNIGKTYLKTLMSKLHDSPALEILNKQEVTNVHTHKNVRIISDVHGTIMSAHRKRRLEMIDFVLPDTPFDVRLSVCVEHPVTTLQTVPADAVFVRKRFRDSYKYKTWRYEATRCISQKPCDEYADSTESFEFELELDIPGSSGQNTTYLANSGVLKIRDLVTMNDNEKINLRSIKLCDRRTYNDK